MAQMTLEQYIKALGESPGHFLMQAGVSGGIWKTIQRGEPIAEAYAKKIAAYLSQEFDRTISIHDISGLKVC
jgi:hypothetical protein